MRALLVVGALAASIGSASADTTSRLKIAGIVPPHCDFQTGSVTLSLQMPGSWGGQAVYNCNAPHLIIVDLGPEMRGAEVAVSGIAHQVGEDGTARIYRSEAHFGSATLAIEMPNLSPPQILLSFQPM